MLIKRLFWNAPVKKKSSFFFLTTFDAIYAQWIYTSERHVWRQWLDAVYVYTVYTFVVLDWKNIRRERKERRWTCVACVMLLLCDNFCWLIVPRSMHPMCVLCVSSLLVCVIIRKERRLKKKGIVNKPPPHHHHRHYVQKSTPLACVHHIAVMPVLEQWERERQHSFIYVFPVYFFFFFILLRHIWKASSVLWYSALCWMCIVIYTSISKHICLSAAELWLVVFLSRIHRRV
jgi:hypothetical protein